MMPGTRLPLSRLVVFRSVPVTKLFGSIVSLGCPPPCWGELPSTVCVFGDVTVGDGELPKFSVRAYAPVPNALESAPVTLT